ncbi:phosphoglycolate phosphatase [Paenirhodobacter enshiensis]|uniref:Phosphoglycolate phosphatase n=1 Tax=Paenirhodobacter enshiensis TaxID=1105367 RepID=A0A086XYW7_9RHOB|nr:phosphoglycolate phosphatase [Paenirhodobacter enshiensis]KFI27217.1 phosphoglycolate phosphatase [Paenirhodobacter enshiensis]
MARPVALIFDLDGTLVDSAPDIHATSNLALAAIGLPELPFETVRGFIGGGVPHLIGALLSAVGEDPDGPKRRPMSRAFNDAYAHAVDLTVLFPHVAEVLAALHAQGHPMAICTNKPVEPARAVLDHFGLDAMFPVVVGGDSLPVRKPDPAPLVHALDALGGGPVLYVGDSETDAATARAARLPFALFTEGYRKTPVADLSPEVAFSDYRELAGLVSALTPGGA